MIWHSGGLHESRSRGTPFVALLLDFYGETVRPEMLEGMLGLKAFRAWCDATFDPDEPNSRRWTWGVLQERALILKDWLVDDFLRQLAGREPAIAEFLSDGRAFGQIILELGIESKWGDQGVHIPVPLVRFAADAGLEIDVQFWPV